MRHRHKVGGGRVGDQNGRLTAHARIIRLAQPVQYAKILAIVRFIRDQQPLIHTVQRRWVEWQSNLVVVAVKRWYGGDEPTPFVVTA